MVMSVSKEDGQRLGAVLTPYSQLDGCDVD